MFDRKTVRDVDLEGRRVLVRVDYNVPLEEGGVGGERRIQASIPTLRHLLDAGAKPALCSHLGRPGGEKDPELSLERLAPLLEDLLEAPVRFVPDCVGDDVEAAVDSWEDGTVLLLENTRFHPGEKRNDERFARDLADPFDLFVGDAFAAAHRAHASTVGVTEHLPAVAGLLMEREVEALTGFLEDPARPFVGVMGGAKVADKLSVVRRLMDSLDRLLTGGGMANTLLSADGVDVRASLMDEASLEEAGKLLDDFGDRIELPVDVVAAPAPDREEEARVVDVQEVPEGWQILDLGPETLDRYEAVLEEAGRAMWNGPVGLFERERFAAGTIRFAQSLARSNGRTLVGGGETGQAVDREGLHDDLDHVSTGGGAFLEFMEGKELPGIAALERRE